MNSSKKPKKPTSAAPLRKSPSLCTAFPTGSSPNITLANKQISASGQVCVLTVASDGVIKTTITGLSSNLKPTLQHFKRAFGTNGRIIEIDAPTSQSGGAEAIQLSGDHRRGVRDTLLRWGIEGSNKELRVETRHHASAA